MIVPTSNWICLMQPTGEYEQNICSKANASCIPCDRRFPSCRGLQDGNQPIKGGVWAPRYVVCRSNRTINVLNCPPGMVFNPNIFVCVHRKPQSTLYRSFNGCSMPAGNAYPSGHLVPSPIVGLACAHLLRPDSSNLPCLYSTFHLEYPLVLFRFCP